MRAWVVKAEKLRANARTRSSGGSPGASGGLPGQAHEMVHPPNPVLASEGVQLVERFRGVVPRGVDVPERVAQDLGVSGVDREGQALDPAVEVLRRAWGDLRSGGARQASYMSLTVVTIKQVVGGVVAEDRTGAHARHLGDLVDGGVEAASGHDLHGGPSDARPCELLLVLGQ